MIWPPIHPNYAPNFWHNRVFLMFQTAKDFYKRIENYLVWIVVDLFVVR